MANFSLRAEALDQLQLLQGLFCLNDLVENRGNYGTVERQIDGAEGLAQDLKIVNFRVSIFAHNFEILLILGESQEKAEHFKRQKTNSSIWKLHHQVEAGGQY